MKKPEDISSQVIMVKVVEIDDKDIINFLKYCLWRRIKMEATHEISSFW